MKNLQRPRFWQDTLHFEFISPLSLADAAQALQNPQSHAGDYYLQKLNLSVERQSAEVYRFRGWHGQQVWLQGYLKALPDGTTLVSSTGTAHDDPQPPLTLEEDAQFQVFLIMTPICGVLMLGLAIWSGIIQLEYFGWQVCFPVIGLSLLFLLWVLFETWFNWRYYYYRRDLVLLALQKRLAVEGEIIELDKEAMTDFPAQKAKQR